LWQVDSCVRETCAIFEFSIKKKLFLLFSVAFGNKKKAEQKTEKKNE
jgi:hypothetical protein